MVPSQFIMYPVNLAPKSTHCFTIGVISRKTDESLTNLFHLHWKSQENDQVDVQTLQLPTSIQDHIPDLSELEKYTLFLRSDHVRFWFVNHQDYYASFKSIHLSGATKMQNPTYQNLYKLQFIGFGKFYWVLHFSLCLSLRYWSFSWYYERLLS